MLSQGKVSPPSRAQSCKEEGRHISLWEAARRWSCWLAEEWEHPQQCCILIIPMQASTFRPSSKEAARGLHSFEGYIGFLKILLFLCILEA